MSRLRIAFLSVAVSAAFASTASAVDIAVNGGFETGDFTGWTQFPSAANPQTIVTPGSPLAGGGSFAANLDNVAPGSASVIKNANIGVGIVAPLSSITVSFDAKGNFGPGGVAFAELFSELSGGGVSATQILGGGGPLMGGASFDWTHFSFTTTTGSDVSGGVTVQFNAATGGFVGSTSQLLVDNLVVQVAAIPEPTAMSLLGIPALALLARRRQA